MSEYTNIGSWAKVIIALFSCISITFTQAQTISDAHRHAFGLGGMASEKYVEKSRSKIKSGA